MEEVEVSPALQLEIHDQLILGGSEALGKALQASGWTTQLIREFQ